MKLRDGSYTTKVADFGMTAGYPCGTYEYMAPECWKAKYCEPSQASDVFSFGICMADAALGLPSSHKRISLKR